MKPNQFKNLREEIIMGDISDSGGNGGDVKRARILVLLIPLALIIIAGGIALANSTNILQALEPSMSASVAGVAQNSATTEAALARDIEREARVLDVIEIAIEDGGAYFWIIDLESGTDWSERDSNAVTRAFDVLFEWAQKNEYEVGITFFATVFLMGADGEPVDVLQGVINFDCPADLVAEYGRSGGSSDVILNQCEASPDGMFISGNAEVPLIGR